MKNDLGFNPKPPTILHIDLNSCFATIEQQANPWLRGRPVAVAAYATANGCILAASVEAKKLGVKTGLRVKDGKMLCSDLIVLSPDPWKYRNVHLALRNLISQYTSDFSPKSIDEFVLNLENFPCLAERNISDVVNEIKVRIKSEIGEWLTVSVGIAPNRFLAKLAAGFHKPDGLDVIDSRNFEKVYTGLELTDLPYIKLRNAARLNGMGIFSVSDFYNSPLWKLKAAFESINGYYWYLRLRGWEIDDVEFGRKSYGNSYALPKPLLTLEELSPILSKLVEKTGARLRYAGYSAGGIHVAVSYRDGDFWHKGVSLPEEIFDSRDIYKKAFRILAKSGCKKPVRELAVSVFNIKKNENNQLSLFFDVVKRRNLVNAIDSVNQKWGNFVITPARMALTPQNAVPDRIAFGGVKELEEFTLAQ
ncbi:MAG: Nucleotidyltransferase/DNA polymerase involved in DNA repair [Candidatus Woesebacteria bacterium GW2011_GWA1_37_8]|uniref:Nucleotidyltransferase/DNA polymerase involved in DNA repair n=2 Tax=Candidatus Woeseibacteriota TaxID=1752722 RepID=A0A0G0PBZ8_9BACT|nr:MAG: Nucleotidyltransferase/DNA polymerase involved in DNA repair [Microgenomates group bacterium GW2011_GWC1_37_12b]KKQ45591.1 MAG: Nucleotidyltransferase/DNA polymerase involved in DNA repair [Candidatus Woesebacteria bacterium GW2011_GWA1_37_8]KKQ86811.1 MAG: Nucleotidyltransferase/DNA polymerase involved in DNA repair [Candidatus Woesebacteria bacterium GW2011_GWB1_38_8b]